MRIFIATRNVNFGRKSGLKEFASKMPFKTFGNSNCEFILSLSHVKRYPEQLTFCRASFEYKLYCETCCTLKIELCHFDPQNYVIFIILSNKSF